MRYAALLLGLLAPLAAQIVKPVSVTGTPGPAAVLSPKPMKIARGTFTDLEKRIDSMLASGGSANDPIDPLGNSRGVFLDDYGAVFTAELSLVRTPTINPFNQTITKETVMRVHQRKLDQIPALRKAMREVMKTAALTLIQLGDNQQLVLVIRLDYLGWEDTSGLPGQILMRADRKSALAGGIKEEIQ